LYLPAEPAEKMPGIILCHSHHAPKSEGELQDLGQMWARRGCLVLVPELLGHGERREHPFRTANDFPEQYRVGRQDYYFRYVLGMQLHALGDSLAGWLVWDLSRGVDLLLSRPGIDPQRIILLGAVAGGGDPAAVAAALDRRIAAVVPFNFGGPQPESRYPLAEDAEQNFHYAGGGSWESTRNLTASARDGFLPWVIVGSVAPRGLIYAHEFRWDQPRDPVWKRLETIYGWYHARDKLDSVHGAGSVRGKSADDTHCNNIGPVHRRGIDPTFARWFQIDPPEESQRERRSADELACWTPELKSELKPQPFHQLAHRLGQQRIQSARDALNKLDPEQRKQRLQELWTQILGDVAPARDLRVLPDAIAPAELPVAVMLHRVSLEVEPDLVVPVLFFMPALKQGTPAPVVVACAQAGKQRLLVQRADGYAKLLSAGIAVCLVDVRGTGETAPEGDSRGRGGPSTDLSSAELMLGRTLLGTRLRDLRTVCGWLRRQPGVDAARIAFWGDSCTPPNPSEQNVAIPLDLEQPPEAEPLGGLLALLVGLYEPDLRAISAHGGLSGYLSLLDGQFCRVPHDIVVPGAIAAGDLAPLAASRAPQPLQLMATVNSLNRLVSPESLAETFAPALAAYRAAGAAEELRIASETGIEPTEWLQQQLLRE
jgi:dienelactone hydrolase